jgi:hypothetical protein
VGSIPIARSNKRDNLAHPSSRYGCSIWLQLKVPCDLFNWNFARIERSHIGGSVAHLLPNHCGGDSRKFPSPIATTTERMHSRFRKIERFNGEVQCLRENSGFR